MDGEEFLESRRSAKRSRSEFVDDIAEEEEDYEDEDDGEDEDEGRGSRKSRKRSAAGIEFFDIEAIVDDEENEEDEETNEIDKAFINDDDDDNVQDDDAASQLQDDEDDPVSQSGVRHRTRPSFSLDRDSDQDIEEFERNLTERYREIRVEDDEDATPVDQQALLPTLRDPKLWAVKCKTGHERQVAASLMHKSLERADSGSPLKIRSVVALDHLKSYIYVEADREAHVREACRGTSDIYSSIKPMLVPLKEMTDVLTVKTKEIELPVDSWVRVKAGTYKGDLAKVAHVDSVRQKVEVQLIPRVDLQAIADKLDGVAKVVEKNIAPPQSLMEVEAADEMRIPISRRGEFDVIDGMKFKDGFLFKKFAIKSVTSDNVRPTIRELENFGTVDKDGVLSDFPSNGKKCRFMKGDAVIVVEGDLKNLRGRVARVEDEVVHIRPDIRDYDGTVAEIGKHLCRYFEPGNHVKVVSGVYEGATGMVSKVEKHVVFILSDATKEDIRVMADQVADSSEVATGVNRIGDYEMHDLVLLDNNGFGVIVRIKAEAFQVLKPDKSEPALVRLREIRSKVGKSFTARDQYKNVISVNDIVRIVEGPHKDKQGSVKHIYKDVVFIVDRHHLPNGGYLCTRARSCIVKGGSTRHSNYDDRRAAPIILRQGSGRPHIRPPLRGKLHVRTTPRRDSGFGGKPHVRATPRRDSGFGGPRHHLVGSHVRIRSGHYKGCCGAVKEVNGQEVRVELESQMRVVAVKLDTVVTRQQRETPSPYGLGSETPMRDSRAASTPIHEGMRTPKYDPAWIPYTPFRDSRATPVRLTNPLYDATNPTYDPTLTP